MATSWSVSAALTFSMGRGVGPLCLLLIFPAADLPTRSRHQECEFYSARMRIFGLKAAVYNGDPVGPNCKGDPQVCDPAGLEFRLSDPPLLFAEGFYKYNQKQGLAGTIVLGGWNHFGSFEHQRFDIAGLPIAVTGRPGRPLDNDWGLLCRL